MSYTLQRIVRFGVGERTVSGGLADAFAGKPAPTNFCSVATIAFTPPDPVGAGLPAIDCAAVASVTPETTKGAFRRPFTNRSACHRPVPAWLCDGWLPRILRVSQAPFWNEGSIAQKHSIQVLACNFNPKAFTTLRIVPNSGFPSPDSAR